MRKAKVEDPAAAQVRVMTVHGSKGLEFDAVILPELDGAFTRREEGLMTLRPDPEGPIEIVTHGLPALLSAAHPELDRVRADVARRRATEALCVLYVAMTRAVHRLDLIVETPRKGSAGLTCAAILRGALGSEGWCHPENRSPWHREEIGKPLAAGRASGPATPLRFAPTRRARALPGLSPSRAKEVGVSRASRLLQPRDAITARGRILHRLLEEVEWIETFDRSDEALAAIARRIEPDERVVRSSVDEFRALLARPEMRRELSNPNDGARVRREMRFALVMPGTDGQETLWTGAFDRVVLRETSAEILDFKTDRVVDAEIYRPQMELYRRALARIAKLDERAIATTLLFVGGNPVERVSL